MKFLPHVAIHYAEPIHAGLWNDPGVICEPKFNGWRVIVEGDQCFSRSGKPLAVGFCAVPAGAICDGELLAKPGLPQDPAAVSRWLAQDQDNLRVVLFDILQVEGRDIRHRPLIERKRHLSDLVDGMGNPRVVACPWAAGDKLTFYRNIIAGDGEGVLFKRLEQPYTGRAWVKLRPDESTREIAA